MRPPRTERPPPDTPRWKLDLAEQQLAPLLLKAERFDPDLKKFPRRVEEILGAALDVPVAFETIRELSPSKVAEHLAKKYGIEPDASLAKDNEPLWGFTFATEKRVVVFTEAALEPEWDLFTKAHELGHVVAEYLPELAKSKNGDLFAKTTSFTPIYRRDPPGHFAAAAGAELKADLREQRLAADELASLRKREAIANSIAAELLAPASEVRRLAREDRQALVARMRATFGLSRRAAEVRLDEVLGHAGAAPLLVK